MTIAALKQHVAEVRGLGVDTLKLVSKGKVLSEDAATVSASGISEAGFVVLFVQAAKAAKPAAAGAASGAGATAAAPSTVRSLRAG